MAGRKTTKTKTKINKDNYDIAVMILDALKNNLEAIVFPNDKAYMEVGGRPTKKNKGGIIPKKKVTMSKGGVARKKKK